MLSTSPVIVCSNFNCNFRLLNTWSISSKSSRSRSSTPVKLKKRTSAIDLWFLKIPNLEQINCLGLRATSRGSLSRSPVAEFSKSTISMFLSFLGSGFGGILGWDSSATFRILDRKSVV